MKIRPIILAGGSGKRLWPLSRQDMPKQFPQLVNNLVYCKDTALRFSTEEFSDPIFITNKNFQFIIEDQMRSAGINNYTMLLSLLAEIQLLQSQALCNY